MNFGALVQEVKDLFGEHVGAESSFIDDATIGRWLNQAQLDFAQDTDGVQRIVTVTLTPGVGRYRLHDIDAVDFLRIAEGGIKWRAAALEHWQTVDQKSHFDMNLMDPNWLAWPSGRPQYIVMVQPREFWIAPAPFSGGELLLNYYGKPMPMVHNTDLPFNGEIAYERFARAVVHKTLTKLYTRDKDTEMYLLHEREYKQAVSEYFQWKYGPDARPFRFEADDYEGAARQGRTRAS